MVQRQSLLRMAHHERLRNPRRSWHHRNTSVCGAKDPTTSPAGCRHCTAGSSISPPAPSPKPFSMTPRLSTRGSQNRCAGSHTDSATPTSFALQAEPNSSSAVLQQVGPQLYRLSEFIVPGAGRCMSIRDSWTSPRTPSGPPKRLLYKRFRRSPTLPGSSWKSTGKSAQR